MPEIKLRLAIPRRAVSRLRRHPLLRGKAQSRQLHIVYYDTPELELWRKGMVFRLRRSGRKWMQSVKACEPLAKADVTGYSEWQQCVQPETPLAGAQPDVSRLAAEGGMPDAQAIASQLQPAFSASFSRTSKNIQYNQSIAICSTLDIGAIDCAQRSLPICELQLELVSGLPTALLEFALALLADLPLAIENRSKAERGFALCRSALQQPVKARAPALDGDVSALSAFRQVAGALLSQVQANREGVLGGGDPEYLHQMRVAVRRMRALCGLYRKPLGRAALKPIADELRWLARALGPARDADVFAHEIWPPLRAALPAGRWPAMLDRQWSAARNAAAAKARRALKSRRYQRLMLESARWLAAETFTEVRSAAMLEMPARAFASRLIARRNAKVRNHGGTLGGLSEAKLHALRIRIKKLRYAADTFSTLFDGAAADRVLAALSRLQDVLGAINDIHVAEQKVAAALSGQRGPAVESVREALAAWRRVRTAALRRKLEAAWRAYLRADAFW